VNATATTYTVDQAFAALEAYKSAKEKHRQFGHERLVSESLVDAANRLYEITNDFFARLTGFKSLNDCLDAQGHGYRPTFREDGGKDRETVFLAEVYDLVAEARGLALRAYRPERAKPVAPTLQSIKDKLRTLRDEAHPGRIKDYPYIRSGGHEFRLGGENNSLGGYYEYYGSWNGTLRGLKDAAERCKSKGGDSVGIGGQWLCCDTLDGDYEPCDGSEWFLELTPDEILAIGKKS
jgi:hypothetical protein